MGNARFMATPCAGKNVALLTAHVYLTGTAVSTPLEASWLVMLVC